MMLMPRRDSFDLFDNFFDDEDNFFKKERSLMRTDIKENKKSYLIDIDMPGFAKEDINLSINNGYLQISAEVKKEENSDPDSKVIRQERFYGKCSRSFYVGEEIDEDEINAEFKNGILKIEIPKKEINKENETKKITIK